ncbi:hypothetical protein BD310DRAFT_938412 [Dichomitus squalens]|uniref:Uncharacterized protein n=1 Tax=Dichomitus squalens TaxID=114155 RepID=A0A4Q9PEU4_9APHY|nr:hypothetical protein BD310DRAFT_938412 [Dichomitus squalens]
MARYQPHFSCPLFSKGSVVSQTSQKNMNRKYVEDESFPRRLTLPSRHCVRGEECHRRSRGFEGELVG